MYNPISTEFFDQLTVAMERKIPSTIEYYQNEEQEKKQKKTETKALVKTMEVIDGFEFLVLDTKEKIRLSSVIRFNGKRHSTVIQV
jgi:Rho-binding antiterminator